MTVVVSRWRALECQTNKIGGLAWAGVMPFCNSDKCVKRETALGGAESAPEAGLFDPELAIILGTRVLRARDLKLSRVRLGLTLTGRRMRLILILRLKGAPRRRVDAWWVSGHPFGATWRMRVKPDI